MLVKLHKVKPDLRDLFSPLILSQLLARPILLPKSFSKFSPLLPKNSMDLNYMYSKDCFLNKLCTFMLHVPLLIFLLLGMLTLLPCPVSALSMLSNQ